MTEEESVEVDLKRDSRNWALVATLAILVSGSSVAAMAQDTVECRSRHHQYGECWAGPLRQPQLIHQISSAACILNNTWGYNPASQYIWVAQGCAGVFADVSGYHHGRGDTFDPNARMYSDRGHDIGAVVGGVVVGALIEGMLSSGGGSHTTSNHSDPGGYNGCHGTGCLVDNPDAFAGCHGIGCLVDNPGDAPPEPGQTTFE